MGEAKRRQEPILKPINQALAEAITCLDTPGGRLQVRWDAGAAVTPFGQMAYFIEFFNLTGLLDGWIADCPLTYLSPNAPTKRDLLGTWLLSILAGHKRYAHSTSIRSDGVNPGLLGMQKVVSEDALRRGLAKIPEEEGVAWLREHLERSALPLLKAPWILDVDATVKQLYGRQEGAVAGYNPKKPGRPSHTYHTYLVAGLRLVLDAEVLAGNESNSSHTLPGLTRLLDRLADVSRPPYLVRGDCGFGNDPVMRELEERGQDYLFKLRLTAGVKRYIERRFFGGVWADAGAGWEGLDGELRLSGWDKDRRVVVLRRRLQGEVLLAGEAQGQQVLGFIDEEGPVQRYEYAVLVTSLPHEIRAVAQLYRDRGDGENSFDELKNQWGWGGFATQDLHRCQLTARAVALAYNWWSLFVRLANPKARLEAVTSRPLLLGGIAEKTSHARQARITITPVHGKGGQARAMLEKVSALLQGWKSAAEQLQLKTVWEAACDHLITILTRFDWLVPDLEPPKPMPEAAPG
jgi:hypothetical protein